MNSRSERFRALMADIDGERLDAIDARLSDPDDPVHTRRVSWREDPDPLGMSWAWAGDSVLGRVAPALPLAQDGVHRRRQLVGIAAAVLLMATGALLVSADRLRKRPGSAAEERIAAWAVDVTADRIAAADQSDRPAVEKTYIDPDSYPTLPPSILAPVTAQERLEVPEVPEGAAPGDLADSPLATVVVQVAEGSMCYLIARAPGSMADGTAVAIRLAPQSWKLLWQEARFSEKDRNSVLGPIKARARSEDYLIVMADRASTSLLSTVLSCLPPAGPPPGLGAWKPRLVDALRRSGRSRFGMQAVRVETSPVERPPARPAAPVP